MSGRPLDWDLVEEEHRHEDKGGDRDHWEVQWEAQEEDDYAAAEP